MQSGHNKHTWVLTILLVGIGILGRLLPHPPNMTPMTGLMLFSGRRLGVLQGSLVLICTLVFSDLVFGFYDWRILLFVYGSFLIMMIGGWILKRSSATEMVGWGAAGSIFFFITTNWAVWQFSPMYAANIGGLMQSYIAALPFLQTMLVGDLLYTSAFMYGEVLLGTLLAHIRAAWRKIPRLYRSINNR